jgi:D-alanyl-D-alanine carboxypeptidase/D-alanyl-D-alanine-endopeptidase (penicillin-binding protein 4)
MMQTGNRALLQAAMPCFFFLLCLLQVVPPCSAGAADQRLRQQIDSLISNGGYILSVDGRILASKNENTPFVPASTLKIVTALGALRLLPADFRFRTDFFLTGNNDLCIKGYGDPSLTSEEIILILQSLRQQGVARINNILLDAEGFELTGEAEGRGDSLNPYDAAGSALAVNFNTVNFTRQPDGTIISAEEQTPTLPIMQRLGKNLPPGTHRINLTNDHDNILIHTGELFRALQRRAGIPGEGAIATGAVPAGARLLLAHRSSQSMEQIIAGLLRYSNNFIANQLFLTCGAMKNGYPATWDKGRQVFREFLASLGLDEQQLVMVEGSGLSRDNLATPAAMLTILHAFRPHARLLAVDQGRLIKSGTLTGVYCYAGYLPGGQGANAFVVMLNQPENRRDRIVNLLEKIALKQ